MEHGYVTDKSWMYMYKTKHERVNPHFLAGVNYFVEFALKNSSGDGIMKCPCSKCENKFNEDKDIVQFHIIRDGFTRRYTTWHFHGESRKRPRDEIVSPIDSEDDIHRMLNDAFIWQHVTDETQSRKQNENFEQFEQLMEEANKPLYAGCKKYSRLSFIVHLFQLKCLHKWSNKSFSAVLALFKDALYEDA